MNFFPPVSSVQFRENCWPFPNPIACLAVHSETNIEREFPQRAYKDHPLFLKPNGDSLRSGTLPQEPQLNWGLKGPEFHFLDHSQNKVSGIKEIIAQPLATFSSTTSSLALLCIL